MRREYDKTIEGHPERVTCFKCGTVKPRAEFERAWRNSGWCKACRNEYRRKRQDETGRQLVRYPRRVEGGIVCSDCKEVLPPERFYWRDRGNGKEPCAYCKPCATRRRAEDRRHQQQMRKEMAAWKALLP